MTIQTSIRLAAVTAAALAIMAVGVTPARAATLSELRLISNLDEPRGYCVDMMGSKTEAKTTSPLQAHSCYSAEGPISVDQGITTSGVVSQGRVRIPYFGVCMASTGARAGGSVTLQTCSATSAGTIRLAASQVHPKSQPGLCLTVGSTTTEGGGGSPVHLKRTLTWQTCAASGSTRTRQLWRLAA